MEVKAHFYYQINTSTDKALKKMQPETSTQKNSVLLVAYYNI